MAMRTKASDTASAIYREGRELLTSSEERARAKDQVSEFIARTRNEPGANGAAAHHCHQNHSRRQGSQQMGEERYFLGDDEEAEIEYGAGENGHLLDAKIRKLCEEIGQRDAARRLGISRTALRRAQKLGAAVMSRSMRARLARRWNEIGF